MTVCQVSTEISNTEIIDELQRADIFGWFEVLGSGFGGFGVLLIKQCNSAITRSGNRCEKYNSRIVLTQAEPGLV